VRVPYLKRAPELAITIKRGALPSDHFTMIPNAYLRDGRLSWEARGLLAWLMSHTPAFKVTEEGMIGAGDMGRDGIRRMVRELETHGYLRRDKTFTPGVGTTVAYVLTAPYDGETVVSDDGETVVRADQGKQDVSAGGPYDGETVAPSYKKEDQEKTKTPSVSKRASRSERATRVPDDFRPTEEMRAWFVAEQLGQVIDGAKEHEKFMDYWQACPGVRGRKLDWPATWRNWMRTAAERAGRRPGNALVPTSGAPVQYKPSTTDQRIAQGQALAAKYREQGL
jgi:hypothetical protein